MNRLMCLAFSIFLLGPLCLHAQSKTTIESRVKRKIPQKKERKSFYQIGINTILWQEEIDANRAGVRAALDSEFKGFGITGNIRKPIRRSRWEQSYGAEAYFGTLLSKGNAVIQDEFERQPWYILTFNPGVAYATTRFSEIGISLPLTYRIIEWKLNDPTLKLDKGGSFSYGLSFNYLTYVAKNHAINFSLTSHIEWSATMWALGWKYRL